MTIKEKYRAFRVWQRKPYKVAPRSEKEHDCFTCHTHFCGNFCPRCGQSANIERYSLKDTTAQFIAVWGVGNRSFFRCLRDLILRPGYMIRDYLNGMQMAYYPPFQLLSTLVVGSWVWMAFLNRMKYEEEEVYQQLSEEAKMATDWANYMMDKFPEAISLYMMLFYALSTFMFFRKSKKRPKLKLSEALIVAVYCACVMNIYHLFVNTSFSLYQILTSMEYGNSVHLSQIALLFLLGHLAYILSLKQLFGGSWMRSIFCVLTGDFLVVIITVIGCGAYFVAKEGISILYT